MRKLNDKNSFVTAAAIAMLLTLGASGCSKDNEGKPPAPPSRGNPTCGAACELGLCEQEYEACLESCTTEACDSACDIQLAFCEDQLSPCDAQYEECTAGCDGASCQDACDVQLALCDDVDNLCNTEFIENGSFESTSSASWVVLAGNEQYIAAGAGPSWPAASGSYMLWFGRQNYTTATVGQPLADLAAWADGTSVTVEGSMQLRLYTQETTTSSAYDVLQIQLVSVDGNGEIISARTQTLDEYSNLDAAGFGNTWHTITFSGTRAFASNDYLVFRMTTDADTYTYALIDDVSFGLSCQ